MKKTGVIVKMIGECEKGSDGDPCSVSYQLPIGSERIPIDQLLGKHITFHFKGEIHCLHCGNITKKSFGQGYCYPCFVSIPETDECILRPELCQAHLGISRDMGWSEKHCLQDHYVYLAISSGLKVGVTRSSQIPTRWIDQGAWRAIQIAQPPNRYLAGRIEVELKKHVADKTNWRQMLKDDQDTSIDIEGERDRLHDLVPEDLKEHLLEGGDIWEFKYPVNKYPEKVKSIGFDKTEEYAGTLQGIKGQYLIFEGGDVLNIRKHNGYLIEMQYEL